MLEHSYLVAFFKGFAFTQAVEIPVVWYLLSRNFRQIGKIVIHRRIIASAFFANMATLPYLWFVYPELLDYTSSVVLGEATALVAEALFYYLILGVPLRVAAFTSFAANSCSVLIGLLIMPPFGGR